MPMVRASNGGTAFIGANECVEFTSGSVSSGYVKHTYASGISITTESSTNGPIIVYNVAGKSGSVAIALSNASDAQESIIGSKNGSFTVIYNGVHQASAKAFSDYDYLIIKATRPGTLVMTSTITF